MHYLCFCVRTFCEQFTAINEHPVPEELAAAVMREIPRQLLSYMAANEKVITGEERPGGLAQEGQIRSAWE